jgi:hypothetical protein
MVNSGETDELSIAAGVKETDTMVKYGKIWYFITKK